MMEVAVSTSPSTRVVGYGDGLSQGGYSWVGAAIEDGKNRKDLRKGRKWS
jgi:hypothetical protein